MLNHTSHNLYIYISIEVEAITSPIFTLLLSQANVAPLPTSRMFMGKGVPLTNDIWRVPMIFVEVRMIIVLGGIFEGT
jgi:hypothetical protein